MNLKFAWIHNPQYDSFESINKNITEYVTIELQALGINVQYFYSLEDAVNSDVDFYAYTGTLFKYEVYEFLKTNTKKCNINDSEFVIFDGKKLYDSIPLINWGLSHQNYFADNTEKFEDTYLDQGDVFDNCVCSAGGITAKLILENVKLSSNARIFVVDISNNSLNLCKERIGNNFEFVLLDLFDSESVEKFLKNISGAKSLWFASNIFNYTNTSLIYDLEIRRRKQQEFIDILSKQKTDWYVSLYTADAERIRNKSVKELEFIKQDIKVLPWVS